MEPYYLLQPSLELKTNPNPTLYKTTLYKTTL